MDAPLYSVHVREYRRVRDGEAENVRKHKRRPRRWWKRPTKTTP